MINTKIKFWIKSGFSKEYLFGKFNFSYDFLCDDCCGFQPATPVLVEVIFFSILTTFFYHKRKKEDKAQKYTKRGISIESSIYYVLCVIS